MRRFLVFVLAMLAGCASLPHIHPDMALPKRSVQIASARGPLTEKQSQAILERLKGGRMQTSIFDRHLAVEEAIVGSPLVAGNKVTLLQDGPQTYEAMLRAIDAARDHINFETYILDDDEAGQRFAEALLAKQRQGVQVNLLYDGIGALSTPRAFFDRLRASGIKVLEFNPVNPLATRRRGWDLNQRDHRKLVIVDGVSAFIGGINISSVYSGGSFGSPSRRPDSVLPWRDTHVQIDGPVVVEFQKLFLDTWNKQRGEPLAPRNYFPAQRPRGKEVVRAIGSAPEEPYSLIYATLISALRSAESEIWLTNAYFAPDRQLLDALKDAAARGVDVKLLLPSVTDSWLVLHAGRSYYSQLLRAGVKIYERRDALLHSKTAVIDGVWSSIGSTNLDWRSFLHNQELNAVILGADFGAQMRAAFQRDLAASQEVRLAEWRRRPFGRRLQEAIGRMWEYWL